MAEREEEPRPGEVNMSFMDHLMELRARIILSLVIFVACCTVSWIYYDRLFELVRQPIVDYNAGASEEAQIKLQVIAPTEAFGFVVSLGIWAGLLFASPIVAYQIWRFVSPGLYRGEKMAILPIFTVGILFFASGAWFAYRYTIPLALEFLAPFAPKLEAVIEYRLRDYLWFFIMIHVSFGIVFETPLVILALARMGLVTARGLVRRWQYVIVGAFILGAILTPPDVMTQAVMAGSLLALYTLSIILAAVFGRRRPESDEEPGEGPEDGSDETLEARPEEKPEEDHDEGSAEGHGAGPEEGREEDRDEGHDEYHDEYHDEDPDEDHDEGGDEDHAEDRADGHDEPPQEEIEEDHAGDRAGEPDEKPDEEPGEDPGEGPEAGEPPEK